MPAKTNDVEKQQEGVVLGVALPIDDKYARAVRFLNSLLLQKILIGLMFTYISCTLLEFSISIWLARHFHPRHLALSVFLLKSIELMIVAVFPLEVLARAILLNPGFREYFKDGYNILDFWFIMLSLSIDIMAFYLESELNEVSMGFLCFRLSLTLRILFFISRAKLRKESVLLNEKLVQYEGVRLEHTMLASTVQGVNDELQKVRRKIVNCQSEIEKFRDQSYDLQRCTWDCFVPIASTIHTRRSTVFKKFQ